jgi:NAD(P)-dependent dehydrogenase (short-subunit alcohol dehydrogenase family)
VASKYGVIGLMGALANELAASGIRVNAICPGTVETAMFEARVIASGQSRDAIWRSSAREHLIPRLVDKEDVANAALWLASDRAAMVTGVAFPVDGGSHARWETSEPSEPPRPSSP